MSFVCTLLPFAHTHSYTVHRTVYLVVYYVQQADRLKQVCTSQSVTVYSPQCMCECACMYELVRCRLMESCHPPKGGCQYALPPLSCALSALRSVRRWRVGCVSMSLLWSEMTLRSTAILPTVNIIQYHSNWNQHGGVVIGWNEFFLPPTRFLLGMCWMMAHDTDLLQERLGWGLSFGRVVLRVCLCKRVSFCACVYLYVSLTVISLFKMIKWANIAGTLCHRCNDYTVSYLFFSFLYIPLSTSSSPFPPPLFCMSDFDEVVWGES